MDANSSIIEDFQEFTCPSTGLIAPTPHGDSGNGVLYSAIAIIILRDRSTCLTTEARHVVRALRNSYAKAIMTCFRSDAIGVLCRNPGNTGYQEGPDDYVGASSLLCAAYFILRYGKSHWFNYNNVNLDKITKSSWLLRQPQLIAHMYYGAEKKPNLFLRLYWHLAILYSALTTKKTDQDGWMLTWLLIRTHPDTWVERVWRKKVKKLFGDQGLKNLNYLNNGNHPITKWWIR